MSVSRNKKTGKWDVKVRYVDWTGAARQTTKRGFDRKSDAEEWEREFKLKSADDVDMTFGDFYRTYTEDMKPRLRENTWGTKQAIVEKKILPYFKDKRLSMITAADIVAWQNEIMDQTTKDGTKYAKTYLKTIHNQMSAILNHAVEIYGLKFNAARRAGNMGKEESKEMLFWTQGEYEQFVEGIADKEESYMAFELLYWCGIRLGELLALTPSDFDFKNNTLRINKSYQRISSRDVITDPKTPKSNRIIVIPKFLSMEMKTFLSHIYGIRANQRIFCISKSFLHHEMDRGVEATGVKRIRIHDLRHSHVSLLINMGFTPLAIGERVGHEAVDITYRYAHLFPTVQTDMAARLDMEREDFINVTKS